MHKVVGLNPENICFANTQKSIEYTVLHTYVDKKQIGLK